MGMVQEFKEFAIKGNAIDMAVGIIIGGAFGKIVASLVNDVIMPPIGQLLGGVDFSNLFLTLGGGSYETVEAAREAGAATLNYGSFLQTVVDFLIIAFVIFVMVKKMNSLKKKEETAPAAPPEPSAEVKLLTEIRDSLRSA
ncbi:MAG: large conductance mechanosensitive channel protein MscL [Thermoanaerobaculia bacterium]|nr:large conductance mechanosensitive channel protein MscL [Thermoanaerobaculia bacterium]